MSIGLLKNKESLANPVAYRRLRSSQPMLDMLAETHIHLNKLIYPMFIVEQDNFKQEIESMPQIFQQSISNALNEIEYLVKRGLKSVILFGIPNDKDELASQAYHSNGIIQKAIRQIKNNFPELIVVADTCLCEYTNHGHCGVIKDGYVENAQSIELIAKTALAQAQAGADIIAPSDMMDFRVSAIRHILDQNGFNNIPIMSYSAKYASSFYGPFRLAAQSAPQFGNRSSYQMDYRNSSEAMREIEQDIIEGADIVMVKPALSYLDIIKEAKTKFNVPIASYNVSGEYAMVKAAGQKGWINEQKIIIEILTSIFRSGCDIVISYHVKDLISFIEQSLI